MLKLPVPDRRRLQNAALPLVVVQVRFDERADVIASDVLARFHLELEAAGLTGLRLTPLVGNQLIFRPGDLPVEASATKRGWTLATGDGQWQFTILGDSLALETPAFVEFDGLRELFALALAGVTHALSPTVAGRIGLRFVNALPRVCAENGDVLPWSQCVTPMLTSALSDPLLGAGVTAMDVRVALTVDEQIRASVRAGLIPDGDSERFLMDIDSYCELGTLWDPARIEEILVRLNEVSVSLFQSLLSEPMLTHLRGEEQR